MEKKTSYRNKKRISNKIKRKTLRKGGSRYKGPDFRRYKGPDFRKNSRKMHKHQNKLAKSDYKRDLKRLNDKLRQKQIFENDSLLSPIDPNQVILYTRKLLDNKLEDLSDLDELYYSLGNELSDIERMKHLRPNIVYVKNLKKINYKLQLLFLIFAGLTTSALSSDNDNDNDSDIELKEIQDDFLKATEKIAIQTRTLHSAVGQISSQYKQIKAISPVGQGSIINLDNAARVACLTTMAPGPHLGVLGPACAVKAYADFAAVAGSTVGKIGERLVKNSEARKKNEQIDDTEELGKMLVESAKKDESVFREVQTDSSDLKFNPLSSETVAYMQNKVSEIPKIKELKESLKIAAEKSKEEGTDMPIDTDEMVDITIYYSLKVMAEALNEQALPRAVQLADMAGII